MMNIVNFCIFSLLLVTFSDAMMTQEGKECIFPFKYDNKWHTTCVQDKYNPHYDPWCAVDYADYDTHYKMGRCVNKTIVPTKTLEGRDCVFPFTYKGEVYYRCALDRLSTWCALKPGNYEDHRQWGYCVGGHKNPEMGRSGRAVLSESMKDYSMGLKQNLTVSGRPCKFPFFWRNIKLYECALNFRKDPWCMVNDKTWDYCLLYPKKEPKYNFKELFSKIGKTKEPVGESCKVKKVRLNQGDREEIVKYTNKVRSGEPAGNMRKVTWSEHLAERAQYFADQCPVDHGETESCYGHPFGQNMAIGYSHEEVSWKFYIYMAFGKSEKRYYNFTTNECSAVTCGHYTQSVWAEVTEIGCAYSNCKTSDELNQIIVCNYYPKGNMPQYGAVNKIRRPYKKGKPCEFCRFAIYPYPYKCEDNHFCEPCHDETEEGCIKYDLCMDSNIHTDTCYNERRIDYGCVKARHEYVKNPNSYAQVRQKCRKSCNMCHEPYDSENRSDF